MRFSLPLLVIILSHQAYSQVTKEESGSSGDSVSTALLSKPLPDHRLLINGARFWRFLSITYVHKIDESLALGVSPQLVTDNFESATGFGVMIETRIFPGTRYFYLAPGLAVNSLGYDHFEGCSGPFEISGIAVALGFTAGWEWCFGGFSFGIGGGVEYYILSADSFKSRWAGYQFSPFANYDGLQVAGRVEIGYGW